MSQVLFFIDYLPDCESEANYFIINAFKWSDGYWKSFYFKHFVVDDDFFEEKNIDFLTSSWDSRLIEWFESNWNQFRWLVCMWVC